MRASGHVKAAFALFVLLCAYFYSTLWGGKVLSQADVLFTIPPWAAMKPPGFQPSNSLLNDQTQYLTPGDIYACESIRRGEVPLWNPLCACGEPFVANYWSAVFSPLNLVLYGVGPPGCYALSALLRLWVAGFCTYLFLRLWSVRFLGAMMGATSFMFGGYMILWLNHRHSNAATWLPVLLLLVEKWARSPRRAFALLLAVAIACVALAGHAYACVHEALAVGLYAVVRMFMVCRWRPRKVAGRAALLLGICALGVALASLQWLPFLEYLPLSGLVSRRIHEAHQAGAGRGVLWPAVIGLVHPFALGTPLGVGNHFAEAFGLRDANFNEMNGGYVGLATFALAFWAVLASWRRAEIRFFAALLLVGFGVGYRLPVVSGLFVRLPPLNLMVGTEQRSQMTVAFMLCCLAGFGFDHVLGARARLPAVRWRIFTGAVFALAAFALLATVAFAVWPQRLAAACQGLLVEPYRSDPRRMARFRLVELRAAVRLLLCSAGLLAVLALRPARPLFPGAVLLLGLVDLFTFGMRHNPSLEPSEFFPETPGIAFLQQPPNHWRVCPYGSVFLPNTPMVYGLRSAQGTDKLDVRRYVELGALIRASGTIASPLLDLLSVRYLVLPPGGRIEGVADAGQKYRLVYDGEMAVWVNRLALPRAFVAVRSTVVESERETTATLSRPDFDFRSYALLDRDLALPGNAEAKGTARLIADGAHYVRIAAQASAPAALILTDMFYPGWRAIVSGRCARIAAADLALRAVALRKGASTVEFVYSPASFKLGLGATLAAALFLCVCAVASVITSGRRF